AGVPVLHFFTGLHEHYHRPSDDTERLNFDGMRRITEFGRDLITALADSPTRPQPQTSDELELLAGLSAEGISRTGQGPAPWGLEGRMDEGGYTVTSLAAWGLAAKSGIRVGDRLLQIGTKRIESEADYQEAIPQLRRGAAVPVVLQRGRFELEVNVR
nr:PDZ domain-containing protein [Pirellulaceae bacterium]